MMVRFLRLAGRMAVRLTTYHDRWLIFLNVWPVASFD
jgi:hypothetical protein